MTIFFFYSQPAVLNYVRSPKANALSLQTQTWCLTTQFDSDINYQKLASKLKAPQTVSTCRPISNLTTIFLIGQEWKTSHGLLLRFNNLLEFHIELKKPLYLHSSAYYKGYSTIKLMSQRDKSQKLRHREQWAKLLCPFQLLLSASVYQPRSLNSALGVGMEVLLHKWEWLSHWPLMINSVSSSHLTGALWKDWGPSHSVTCLAPLTHSEALWGFMQNYLAKHRYAWKQKFMSKNNKMFLSPPNQSRNYKCLRTQGQRSKMHCFVSQYTCTVTAATVRW